MGSCQSFSSGDPDDQIIKLKNKQRAQELKEFQRQLRLQKCQSELDMNGKGTTRKAVPYGMRALCKVKSK